MTLNLPDWSGTPSADDRLYDVYLALHPEAAAQQKEEDLNTALGPNFGLEPHDPQPAQGPSMIDRIMTMLTGSGDGSDPMSRAMSGDTGDGQGGSSFDMSAPDSVKHPSHLTQEEIDAIDAEQKKKYAGMPEHILEAEPGQTDFKVGKNDIFSNSHGTFSKQSPEAAQRFADFIQGVSDQSRKNLEGKVGSRIAGLLQSRDPNAVTNAGTLTHALSELHASGAKDYAGMLDLQSKTLQNQHLEQQMQHEGQKPSEDYITNIGKTTLDPKLTAFLHIYKQSNPNASQADLAKQVLIAQLHPEALKSWFSKSFPAASGMGTVG